MSIRNFTDIKSFLLDNKTLKQTILKNTFWLAGAQVISGSLKLVLMIFIARILGVTEYGKFTFAFSFVSILVILSDFALPTFVTREFSKDKKLEKEEFPAILSLKIFLSFIALLLMLVGSLLITFDPSIQKIIWILSIYILVDYFSRIIFAPLRARQKMEYEAWAKVLNSILITSFGLLVLFYIPSINNISLIFLLAAFISFLFITLIYHLKFQRIKISFNKKIWQKYLSISWPALLGGACFCTYQYMDSVMLGAWGMIRETGYYNAAYWVIGISIMLGSLMSQTFFPALSHTFSNQLSKKEKRRQKIWSYQLTIMIILAVPLMVGGIVLAPNIINFLYGSEFQPSILAFQILIIVAGLICLSTPFGDAMIASNNQVKSLWIVSIGAVLNIILNFILIPRWTLYGAAFATLITFFVMLIMWIFFTKKFVNLSPFNHFFVKIFSISLLVAVLMYFIITSPIIFNLNIILTILIGIVFYFGVLLGINHFLKIFVLPS